MFDSVLNVILDSKQFEFVLGRTLPNSIAELIDDAKLEYRPISIRENDSLIARYHQDIITGGGRFTPSGPERAGVWDDAWHETLIKFESSNYNVKSLCPPFINKAEYIRWNGHYIYPVTPNLELRIYEIIRAWIYEVYVRPMHNSCLYEFGAGSCYNLVEYCKTFPNRNCVALDWSASSVQIAESLREKNNLNIHSYKFDFFEPDYSISSISANSIVLTVGAIEQVGKNYKPFLDFLMVKKPARIIHLEPTLENYDPNNPFDKLAIDYHLKRNYIQGYKTALLDLAKHNYINIVDSVRTSLGSKYHEGYQLLVWEPNRAT